MKKILFVCSGNTCRSPMANGIFTKMLEQEGINDVTCTSAGVTAADGEAASENAIEVLQEIGVDISQHRSKRVTEDLLNQSDIVVCLAQGHLYWFKSRGLPEEKLCLLGNGISDPYGGSISKYERTRDEIIFALEELLAELENDANTNNKDEC